jgi:ATP-binding cassette, subfamily B, bacterial
MGTLREEIAWPVSRLGDLVENLTEEAGLLSRRGSLSSATIPQAPAFLSKAHDTEIGRWIDASLQGVGLEAETISVGYAEIEKFLQRIHPIILSFSVEGKSDPARLVGIISARGSRARVLLPDRRTRWIKIELLREMICKPWEVGIAGEIDRLLEEAGTPVSVLQQARKAIFRDQLGNVLIQAGWTIRHSPGVQLGVQLRRAKLTWTASGLILVFLVQQLLGLLGWIIIGRGIFAGQFDWSWMSAWVLVLLSTIPLGMMVSDFQAEISLATGSIFKQRLLYGILNLKPDEIRHLGMGQFLGRVMESEAVEMLAFGGGFSAILSLIELGLAAYI